MSQPPINRELYADIMDAGGLVAAVQQSLARNESPLSATGIPESRFPVYARVELGDRFSQIYVAAEERLFLFDIWRDGVMYGNGRTADIDEMTRAITNWVGDNSEVSEIGQLPCIQLVDNAHVYDSGNEVEHRWNRYLSDTDPYLRDLMPFIKLAAQHPVLRSLFPYTSHLTFCFSRCTGYPFSYDCPHVTPNGTGQFSVGQHGGQVLGTGDADLTLSLVVNNLPANCGAAIRGTAAKLDVS
ncbi:MAG: DUF6193 family natural product biosynthesis protein [Pirellulaceae bacterium]